MADEAAFVIANVAMDGTDVNYTAPDNISSIAFQAQGGDITMKTLAAGAGWLLKDGAKESLDARVVWNHEFYFNGPASASESGPAHIESDTSTA